MSDVNTGNTEQPRLECIKSRRINESDKTWIKLFPNWNKKMQPRRDLRCTRARTEISSRHNFHWESPICEKFKAARREEKKIKAGQLRQTTFPRVCVCLIITFYLLNNKWKGGKKERKNVGRLTSHYNKTKKKRIVIASLYESFVFLMIQTVWRAF